MNNNARILPLGVMALLAFLSVKPAYAQTLALSDKAGELETTALRGGWGGSIEPANDLFLYGSWLTCCVLLIISVFFNVQACRGTKRLQQRMTRLLNKMRFMQVLLDGAPTPLYVRDRAGALLVCNKAYLDFFDISLRHVLGKTLSEAFIVDPALAEKYEFYYEQVLSTGRAFGDVFTITFNATRYHLYLWVHPYYDEQGVVSAVVCGWSDVSERENLIDRLRDEKNKANAESQYKSEFLAVMSHELRTPLTAIMGALDLIELNELAPQYATLIGMARHSSHDMVGVIGRVLDITSIESGKIELVNTLCRPVQLVQTVVDKFSCIAQRKGLQLNFEGCSDNVQVRIDTVRFNQVVSNLISNALKFTAQGAINVELNARLLEGHRTELTLSVQDSGIGIDPSQQSRLFKPYSQIAASEQSRQCGTGLGLYICKQLMFLMNGSLTCQSKLGEGSRFTLVMVAEGHVSVPAFDDALTANVRASLQPCSVLLVEDDELSRRVLTLQLESLGAQVFAADDGVEGLKLWRSRKFDYVLTDSQMPNMGGHAFVREIRRLESESNQAPVRILGITANAQNHEVVRCKKAGMNDCLFKPFTMDALASALSVAEQVPQPDIKAYVGFDHSLLHTITRGSPEKLSQLLSAVVKSCHEDIAALEACHDHGNFKTMAKLCHKIKGCARMMRAQGLVMACLQLELALECSAESSTDKVRPLLNTLTKHMNALVGDIKDLACNETLHSEPMCRQG